MRAANLLASRFDSGIRLDMTRSEVIAVLGEPFHRSHAGINYRDAGRKIVDFGFRIERQFPKNEEQWNVTELWVISINGTEWVNNGMQAYPRNSGR